ncbi:MAG: transporter [Acidobacteria bacterium]|nr:MAG: transporter [Acidobacteriota bacterium]
MNRPPAALTAAALLLASPLAAAPITFSTALPVTQGAGVLRLMAEHAETTSGEGEIDDGALQLVLAWGLSPKLTVFGLAPWRRTELRRRTPAGLVSRRGSGLGDVTLLARFTAFKRDAPGSTLRLAPLFGVEVPTGRDDEADARGPLPRPLQPGSGAWNPVVGLVVTRQTLGWQLDAAASYKASGTDDGIDAGDVARLDLSYQHRVWPRRLGGGVPAFVYAVIESNLVDRSRDRTAGRALAGTGGTTWYLAPGVQYVRRRLVLEAAVQLPLAESPARDDDPSLIVSARINF